MHYSPLFIDKVLGCDTFLARKIIRAFFATPANHRTAVDMSNKTAQDDAVAIATIDLAQGNDQDCKSQG